MLNMKGDEIEGGREREREREREGERERERLSLIHAKNVLAHHSSPPPTKPSL